MKFKIAFLFFLGAILLSASCSSNGKKSDGVETASDTTIYKEDTTLYETKRYHPSKEELKAMQEEEAREEAREEYYSTDGDQADNPDFDDDIPGDEHDEEFIDNDGDPELYNE